MILKEPEYYDEYEIDLRKYIMLLWRSKWFIIGLFIVAVLGAGLFSQFYLSPTYQTETTIFAPDFELITGKSFAQNDYLSFLEKTDIKNKIIKKYNLDREENNLTPQNLENKISIKKNNNSNLVSIIFKGSNPQQDTKILKYWVDLFRKDILEYIEEENNSYLSNLNKLMKSKKDKLEKARNEVSEFKEKTNLSLLNAQLTSVEKRLIDTENSIKNIERNISKNESKYNEVNKQLSETDKLLVTEELITDSVLRKIKFLYEKYENVEELNNISTKQEALNPAYNRLIITKNNIKQSIESDKTELKIYNDNLKTLEKKVKELQVEIANKEKQLESLNQKLDIARKNYQNSEEKYSEKEQLLGSKDYQITIVNNPVVPQSPISPNIILNVAIAGVLAIMLGVFIVFFREFLKEDENKEIQA